MAVNGAASGKSKPVSPSKNSVADGEYSLAPLTETIGFLTRVVQVQIMDRVRAAGGLGISMAAFSLLRLINANPGIRQAHMARILVIQESNMVNLVKDMLEQGFIERRGEGKGKRGGLWITDKGSEQLKNEAALNSIDRSYTSVLSDKEYRQLVSLLNRVYRASL